MSQHTRAHGFDDLAWKFLDRQASPREMLELSQRLFESDQARSQFAEMVVLHEELLEWVPNNLDKLAAPAVPTAWCMDTNSCAERGNVSAGSS